MYPRPTRLHYVLAAAVALLTLAACTPTPTATVTVTPSPVTATPTASPTPTTTPTPETRVVPAYYVVAVGNDVKLAREFVRVSGDPVLGAVRTMISGPRDPDYRTTWNRSTRVLGVTRTNTQLTVDLSDDARTANVGSAVAALMVQQLIYTATGAAGVNLPVLLTVDGKPAGELWGVLTWDKPIKRASALGTRLLVQINSPGDGDAVGSPVTVTGEAAVFEAVLPWRVLNSSGKVVRSGTTRTAQGQTFSPFRFQVKLAPGRYTVVIEEDDPSAGAGGALDTDSKRITVR